MVGQTARMAYKPGMKDFVLSLARFGYWTWNKSRIVPDGYFVIGNSTLKGKFWLKIKDANKGNSGLYSFMVNGTVLRQWELHITRRYLHKIYIALLITMPCQNDRKKQYNVE